jgi:hypothetical protein
VKVSCRADPIGMSGHFDPTDSRFAWIARPPADVYAFKFSLRVGEKRTIEDKRIQHVR